VFPKGLQKHQLFMRKTGDWCPFTEDMFLIVDVEKR
jgi:hypothetical protein